MSAGQEGRTAEALRTALVVALIECGGDVRIRRGRIRLTSLAGRRALVVVTEQDGTLRTRPRVAVWQATDRWEPVGLPSRWSPAETEALSARALAEHVWRWVALL